MIKLNKVRKLIGNFMLRDITFEIPCGYIIGLIGANGCGKTSLLHILLGLYQPHCGEVEIMGKTYASNEKELHDMTGVVLQERLFEEYMTLLENARFYGRFYSNYDETYFLQMLKTYGLDAKKNTNTYPKAKNLNSNLPLHSHITQNY